MSDEPVRLMLDAEYGGESARLEFEAKTFRTPRFATQSPGVRITFWAQDGMRVITISAAQFERLVKHAPELHRVTTESWAAAAISPPPPKD